MSDRNHKARFIPGIRLNEMFFHRVVRPILRKHWPRLRYTAALVGCGSDVLGLDTPRSRDHYWGPRLLLFLSQCDYDRLAGQIVTTLTREMPPEFMGYSTSFDSWERLTPLEQAGSGSVRHAVEVYTLAQHFRKYLAIEPSRRLTTADWLRFADQSLLEVTEGKVYHDGLKTMGRMRRTLRYYPRDVWLYMLASQWNRIGQEEAFMGRCGELGDELGSALVAARLVRDLTRLCFLMERRYAPYSKWLGTAMARLTCGRQLAPIFLRVLHARSWRARQAPLCQAYRIVARMHNRLKITPPLPTEPSNFHGRPFLIIQADVFADHIRKRIRDVRLRKAPHIGSADQFVDCTDLSSSAALRAKLKCLWGYDRRADGKR